MTINSDDWQQAQALQKSKISVQVTVQAYVENKGVIVLWQTIRGLIPKAHLVSIQPDNWHKGQQLWVTIIGVWPERKFLIFSENAKAVHKQRKAIFEVLQEGDIVEVVVKKLHKDYALVDVDGITGVIGSDELAWQSDCHPHRFLQIGQTVETLILQKDTIRNRFILSLKRLQKNPWDEFETLLLNQEPLEAVVVNVVGYGVFVILETGISGLLHRNEMSDKMEMPQKGDKLTVWIKQYDKDNYRIAFTQRITK